MRKHSYTLRRAIHLFATAPENQHLTLRQMAAMLGVSASQICQIRQDDELGL